MYEPDTDSIIVNVGENSVHIIRCKECNFSVTFDDPNDVVYLYHALHISAIFNPNDRDTIFNFTLYFSKLKIYQITFRQKIFSSLVRAGGSNPTFLHHCSAPSTNTPKLIGFYSNSLT